MLVSEGQNSLEMEMEKCSSEMERLDKMKLSREQLEAIKDELKGDCGMDGKDGRDGEDGQDGTSVDEIAVVKKIKQELPDFGEVFRDGLELLEGENRLDRTAIKGLEDYEETARFARRPFNSGGGLARGVADDLYAPISILGTYLKLDGTSITTAEIPFAQGIWAKGPSFFGTAAKDNEYGVAETSLSHVYSGPIHLSIGEGENDFSIFQAPEGEMMFSVSGDGMSITFGPNTTVNFSNGLSAGNVLPLTDNTYYLGKNDDDTPFAWKGVILKDTTNGKYYRVEVINGVVTATDLTD